MIISVVFVSPLSSLLGSLESAVAGGHPPVRTRVLLTKPAEMELSGEKVEIVSRAAHANGRFGGGRGTSSVPSRASPSALLSSTPGRWGRGWPD